jgi:hypothetical protein
VPVYCNRFGGVGVGGNPHRDAARAGRIQSAWANDFKLGSTWSLGDLSHSLDQLILHLLDAVLEEFSEIVRCRRFSLCTMPDEKGSLSKSCLLVLTALNRVGARLFKDQRVIGRVNQEYCNLLTILLHLRNLKIGVVLIRVLADQVTPNLSSEDFIGAAKALAGKYNQVALIISRQGVTTLETPAGEVWGTLTTAGAVENALLKLMKARSEFGEGKLEGVGFSELKRLKEKGRDSTFYFDNAEPDSGNDWLNKGWSSSGSEGAKTSSVKPGIFVTVPVNNFGKWGFSCIGLNYPDW